MGASKDLAASGARAAGAARALAGARAELIPRAARAARVAKAALQTQLAIAAAAGTNRSRGNALAALVERVKRTDLTGGLVKIAGQAASLSDDGDDRFTARADLRGRALNLSLSWVDVPPLSTSPCTLRVLRQRFAISSGPDDGLVLIDLGQLLGGKGPWASVQATRYLADNPRSEGGVLQAEIISAYTLAGDTIPAQITVRVYDATAGSVVSTPIPSVTRLTGAPDQSPGLQIYNTSPSGVEVLAGTVLISTATADQDLGPAVDPTTVTDYTRSPASGGPPPLITSKAPTVPQVFTWTAMVDGSAAAPVSAYFTTEEARVTSSTVALTSVSDSLAVDVTFSVEVQGVAACRARFVDASNLVAGDASRSRSITITDGDLTDGISPVPSPPAFDPGLRGGETYYYAAFPSGSAGTPPLWTTSATATGRHGFSEKLFALLPAIHRLLDDPAGGQQGSWQLRNFLSIFGPVFDAARSSADALLTLHDIFNIRADFLPYLADLIGWELDQSLPTARQRNDILFAPEVYATVGTSGNVQAMLNRATGQTYRVKEFVNNVFRTNAPESIRLWEIWQAEVAAPLTATVLSLPATPKSRTTAVGDSIDARPAVVADPNGGSPWVFWHSDRVPPKGGARRRRIWTMRADGTIPPAPVLPADDPESLGDACPAAIYDPQAKLIRLFWSSIRAGRPNLWTVNLAVSANGPVPQMPPSQLTDDLAGDDFPAVAVQPGATPMLWLFWQSARRGQSEIWAMNQPLAATPSAIWSALRRVSTALVADTAPTAAIDPADKLNLFWSSSSGDRSRIFQSVLTGTTWGLATDVSSNLPAATPPPATNYYRDEAPAAIAFGGNLWLFWHSDRDAIPNVRAGLPRVYVTQCGTGGSWSAAAPITVGRSAEKEPAPFVSNADGSLQLLFRTQRGGEVYRSRTVDFSNLALLQTGQPSDRWHYTYSTAGTPDAWCARDAVGLFVSPSGAVGASTTTQTDLGYAQNAIEPFRPITVRFVPPPPQTQEVVYSSPADISDSYDDVVQSTAPSAAVVNPRSTRIAPREAEPAPREPATGKPDRPKKASSGMTGRKAHPAPRESATGKPDRPKKASSSSRKKTRS